MTGPWVLATTTLLAFAGSAISLSLMLRSRWGLRFLDLPNQRSLHQTPVPRVGGLAIAIGVAAACIVGWASFPGALRAAVLGACALAAVSWIDDTRSLRVAPRFAAHIAVAAIWAWSIGLPPAWLPVVVVLLGWSTNLYNFMDGADGLAGGMTVFGFGAYAAACVMGGAPGAATLTAAVCAASLGFLLYNAPPARVFLGDSGSIPLGFLAAAIGIHGWREGLWGLVFPLLAFLPFWFDATATLAIRVLRGARPWEAHSEHFYQKAVRGGLGHRGTALRAWCLMAASACVALATLSVSPLAQALILGCAIALAATVAAAVEHRFRESKP